MGFLVWLVLGVTLLIAEILTGTFVFLFFGLAGCLVALNTALYPMPFWLEGLIFGVLSLAGVALFRKKMLARQGKNIVKNDVDQTFVLELNIAPGQEEMVSYQGSMFRAQNVSQEPLKRGDRVLIIKTEGTKLQIQKN